MLFGLLMIGLSALAFRIDRRVHPESVMIHETIPSIQIFKDSEQIAGRVVEATLDELTPGDVVIKAAYSSVNYKDALAATTSRIIRTFPRIGGIDAAGTVVSSADSRFKEGDQVIATSYEIGVGNDGGYSEYVRVPGDWVVPLPAGLTLLNRWRSGRRDSRRRSRSCVSSTTG